MILVIVLAVFFNLNTFFEFTYGTYSEIYCAEASGCEGWEARQLASSDSHSCIFTRETGSWSSDGHLFIQFTALKMDPIYNSLSIGFNIIEGKGDLPCDKAMDTKKASLNSNYVTEDNHDPTNRYYPNDCAPCSQLQDFLHHEVRTGLFYHLLKTDLK